MAIFPTALTTACRLLLLSSLLALGSCVAATAPPTEEGEVDATEPDLDRGRATLTANATVTEAINASCSTSSVQGLSEQVVAQMNCISPNSMAALPERANVSKSDATFAYMQSPARDALVAALDANPSKHLGINSMFRTVAQQFVLYEWSKKKKCGVALAAKPGSSNHESGLALDTSQHATWRTALESRGFKWFGSKDKVHFDYVGSGIANLKGVDVKAFQMLWNVNHPQDKIAEDGQYGPATAARLAKSPAAGFALGSTCGAPPADSPSDNPNENPSELPETAPEAPEPSGSTGSCANHCGSAEPAPSSNPNCYCDTACSSNGDCCADFSAVCAASTPPPPPPPTPAPSGPSCSGLCGSSAAAPGSDPACYCDASCVSLGDCCSDAVSICGF